MKPNYEALGDVISALDHIDQAQAEFERGSQQWVALGSIHRLLNSIDLDLPEQEEEEVSTKSCACMLGNCNECTDIQGNCCDCNCHLGLAVVSGR